jgi:DNA-binding NarL/FixJ family response regulator
VAEATLRRVAIGACDPNWAGAVTAALAGAGIEVVAIASEPLEIPVVGVTVAVLAFDADGLREGVQAVDVPAGVLAVGPDDMDLMVELLEAGALGYLLDDSGFDEITRAVEQLLGGHAVVPPAALGTLLRRVVDRRRARSADTVALESLTPREREVFESAARGCDNDAIAATLYISAATARTHLQRVFKKLGVHSRAEAVGFAVRCGLDIEGDA